jgi:hypothetical protein
MISDVKIKDVQRLFDVAEDSLIYDKFKCNIPFFEDCDGKTPLELALANEKRDEANCLLKGIMHYPYLHSGPMLARSINMAFKQELPDLDKFLEARLVNN